MATDKNIKLFKLASEINIGRDTIVDFLNGKGFDIVNKPITSLTPVMVDLVYEKFRREKKAAETVREKIQKHKDIRVENKRTVDDKYREDKLKEQALHHHLEEVAAEIVEPEPIIEPIVKAVPIEPIEEVSAKTEKIIPEIEEAPKAEVTKAEPVEIVEEKVKPEEVVPAKVIEVAPEVEEVKAIEPEIVPETVEIVKEVPVKETKIEHKHVKAAKEEKKEDKKAEEIAPQKVEPVAETIEVVEPVKESKIEASVEKIEDKNEIDDVDDIDDVDEVDDSDESDEIERQQLQEKDDIASGRQLRGLTVLGKIDIKAPKSRKERAAEKAEKKIKADKKAKQESDEKAAKAEKRRPRRADTRTSPPPPTGKEKEAPAADGDKSAAKPKQFKKRKHNVGETPVQQPSTKQVLDLKTKFKDKPKIEEKAPEKDDKKKRKRKKSIRETISQEDVDRAIRETLSGMDSGGSSQRNRMRLKRKAEREEKEMKIAEDKAIDDQILKLSEYVTTSDLASLMGISPSEVIMKCMELNLMVTINQRLDKDTISMIALDYGYDVEFLDQKQVLHVEEDIDPIETLKPRAPIVTIMGHVDHGKTSLLDHIRSANVVAGEAGGITQHIGAYSVELPNGKSITFLDTPGHEAFTAMRARGAQVTDIVVLVVAADDSVMPQSIEAISHAKAAKVPIVVAINKVDKIDSNPDRIKQQLADYGVLVEEWGGNHQAVEISAKFGKNIDTLLEKILLEAEILELKANPDRLCKGVVIESNMKQGFGAVATVIIQKGTLKVGDPFVAGFHSGKVRALLDEREKRVDSVGPADPILVVGFDGLPESGDSFMSTGSEIEAREIANERKKLRREQELRQTKLVTLDQISAQIQLGGVKELNLVIKGDVTGSVEALSDSLQKLSTDEVKVQILHKGVGTISETDVMLAAASGAVVIGFSVNPSAKARKAAESEQVDIRLYNIIYDCINEIQLALEGLLAPEYKEEITATVEVRKTFKISRLGVIAGCYVLSGKITRNDKIRVRRDGFVQFEGGISSLKRGKDDVKEVDTAYECGIQIDGYNDLQESDIIESFKLVEIKRKLK
ncbi:MAG: translation initiation factor IF-2 [Ignavibacteriae bacterium HGW-Ignavibacteriae-1]|jgi:translation initiation factor IF-2|nr:MAG: translation initiation factor IF-2 [Ignavibacteriae bacterium HGW-Ignavibacteriae-1]